MIKNKVSKKIFFLGGGGVTDFFFFFLGGGGESPSQNGPAGNPGPFVSNIYHTFN